jgi:septal ring factor EnvC (AmiA/AmiB activator)
MEDHVQGGRLFLRERTTVMTRCRTIVHGGLMFATLTSCAPLSGCGIEARVGEVNQNLAGLRSDLDTLRQSVDRIARLDMEIEAGVERLDTVQSSLSDLDQEIRTVAVSLRDLDVHLASLRTTIKRIDALVPFVDVTDPAPVEKPK